MVLKSPNLSKHLHGSVMTANSPLCLVLEEKRLVFVQFEDYNIEYSFLTCIADEASIVATNSGRWDACSIYGPQLIIVYFNTRCELYIARFEDFEINPISTKIGESESISGYSSCEIVNGSLLVITYSDKVCIHCITDAAHFAHPLVLSLAVENASVSCNVFSFRSGDSPCQNTLAIRFLRRTSSLPDNEMEIEWLLFNATVLQELLSHGTSNGNTCGTPTSSTGTANAGGPPMKAVCSPVRHHSEQLWTLAPHAYINSIDSVLCTELAGTSIHCNELSQYYNFEHITCTRSSAPRCVIDSNAGHTETLFVAINKDFELVWYTDSILQYKKQLPLTSIAEAAATKMQITSNANNPLLILCTGQTVLLLDLLHNSCVLKEFSNVGACVCASLFHPLSQQLFIIPRKEVNRLNIQSIADGYVYKDANTLASSAKTSNTNDALSDWFVYELPSCSDNLTRCRSMDPTGRWREDSKFTIDADTYNAVQWRRQLKHYNVRNTANNCIESEQASAVSSKRSTENSAFDDPTAKRMKVGHGSIGNDVHNGSSGSNYVISRTNTANAPPGATTSSDTSKVGLIQTIQAQLHMRQQDVRKHTLELQYKQASVDYLRSLVASRASSNFIRLEHGHGKDICGNSIGVTTDRSPSPIDENRETVDCAQQVCAYMQYARDTCSISSAGFKESNQNKSVYLQRLERMEQKYLAPVFGSSVPNDDAFATEECTDYCEDIVHDDDPAGGISVDHLQYTIIPNMQQYSIEVNLTLRNSFPHTLYDIKVSALPIHHCSTPRLHTTSGIVDALLPTATATIVAKVSLPINTFISNESTDVSVRIAVNWRECSFHWPQDRANQSTKNACISEYSQVLNGRIKSRALGQVVGIVHLSMQDIYYAQNTMQTPEKLMQYEDAQWQGYLTHKRQAELQQSPYKVAMPCCSAENIAIKSNDTIYLYLPSVEVTISNAALHAQSVLAADTSLFSMKNIVRTLQRTSTQGTRSTDLVVSVGESKKHSHNSKDVCRLAFPDPTGGHGVDSTHCTGILTAPRACTRSPNVAMGDALLRLRQLLPSEVHLWVGLSHQQKRCAVWQTALCLLEEFKLIAVTKRIRSQLKQNSSQAEGTPVKATNTDLNALQRRTYAAKVESDQVIAFLFNALRM